MPGSGGFPAFQRAGAGMGPDGTSEVKIWRAGHGFREKFGGPALVRFVHELVKLYLPRFINIGLWHKTAGENFTAN